MLGGTAQPDHCLGKWAGEEEVVSRIKMAVVGRTQVARTQVMSLELGKVRSQSGAGFAGA